MRQKIEEHVAGFAGENGGLGLIVGNLVQSDENCGINGASIVEESARDSLDTLCAFLVKLWTGINVGELHLLAVDRSRPEMRGVLGNLGCGIMKLGERLGHILWHRNVNVTGVIVPVEREAEIAGIGPIFGKVVFQVRQRGDRHQLC